MAEKDTAALRKRAQIAKASRLMFIWVAIASVVVSASTVMVIVMAQKGIHNQKAITELKKTEKTLKDSNENIDNLKSAIRALGSDKALLGLRANESDNALQVILDALPADSNPSALGASLQTKLFPADLEVDSMEVIVAPEGEVAVDPATEGEGETPVVNKIGIRFAVKGDAAQLKTVFERLEQSIRTIQVLRVTIESAGDSQMLSVEAEAYYEPAKTLELKNMDVKP